MNNFNDTQDNNTNQFQNNYGQNGMNSQFNPNANQQDMFIENQGTYKAL